MHAAATRLVVEDDHPRRAFQVIAAIRPHVRAFGLALARIKLLHRRFVGVQGLALLEQLGQAIDQRLQTHAQLTDPLRKR